MAIEKKPRKKKLNQVEIEQRINADFRRRDTYIVPRENVKEFKLPQSNSLNRMLLHCMPLSKVTPEGKHSPEGIFDEVQYYYIPHDKFNSLETLFKEFKIPEQMHEDLTGAYLSMFFAGCEAFFSTNHYEQFESNQKELFESIDFLEKCLQNEILIQGISFEFKDRIGGNEELKRPIYSRVKSKKFKGHVAVQFIEKILQNYKDFDGYGTYKRTYDHRKKYGKTDMFFGHKNAEKHYQSYFSSVIFRYLTNGLFNSAFDLLEKPEEYQLEIGRLRKLYSRRKMFLFIGKLMILSELLSMKEISNDEEGIIENIEKKLTPHLRAKKNKLKSIEERNANSTDGNHEITMFGDLF